MIRFWILMGLYFVEAQIAAIAVTFAAAVWLHRRELLESYELLRWNRFTWLEWFLLAVLFRRGFGLMIGDKTLRGQNMRAALTTKHEHLLLSTLIGLREFIRGKDLDCPCYEGHNYGCPIDMAEQAITFFGNQPKDLKGKACSVEGCLAWAPFQYCGIPICYEHDRHVEIKSRDSPLIDLRVARD